MSRCFGVKIKTLYNMQRVCNLLNGLGLIYSTLSVPIMDFHSQPFECFHLFLLFSFFIGDLCIIKLGKKTNSPSLASK